MIPNRPKIAFIGTGSMGRPMIFKLLNVGYTVNVYDKHKKMAEMVIAAGAVWANSPCEVARGSDIVITCLPLPSHVLENMTGENGALQGMSAGATWIDISTTDYHNTRHIAAIASQKGIFSLEAPVSNLSHMGVDFTNASFYVGGDQEGYNRSKTVLDTMGKISFYIGEIGSAQTVKLLTNLLFYTATVTVGEILCLAQEADIPLYWIWDFIKASSGNSVATEQFLPFLFDGSYDSSCTLEITVKDMNLTVALADELGVALPLGRIVNDCYNKAGGWYDGQDNHLKVIKISEVENKLALQILNFIAPSKYGANPAYVRPELYLEDGYGRIKPKLPASYQSPPFKLEPHQIELAQNLTDFTAYVNFLILKEAYQLGHQMGLSHELLVQVIRWSVGACWVSDNEQTYRSNTQQFKKLIPPNSKLYLPTIQKMLVIFNENKREET